MINTHYTTLFQNEDEVRRLTRRILEEGCVSLPDFLDRETFDRLLHYSQSLEDKDRRASSSITWHEGTPAMNLARSEEFMCVFDAIHRARCEFEGQSYGPLQPARQCISLQKNTAAVRSESTWFHFDDSYVNAVLVFRMPTNSREGNLLIYRKLRSIKPRVLSKIVARLLRHMSFLRIIFRPQEINYQEGGLHIFFGDLSFHCVPRTSHGERLTLTVNASR